MKRSPKNWTTGPVIKFWLQLLGPCKEEDDEVEAERRGGLQLARMQAVRQGYMFQTLCFCWRRVRDRGHSNVSTCMSFALYSDNLHLPLAARTGRAFMHFFFPCTWGGVGWGRGLGQ